MKISEIREKFPMYKDVPDEQLVIGLHKKFYADMPFKEFHKNVQYDVAPDPTEGMGGFQKAVAGYGQAVPNLVRGVKQIAGLSSQEEVDEAKKLDAPLLKTGAGMAGNILGNAAMLAPTIAIPGANTFTGAAAIGAATGALQPTGQDESRLENAGIGGLAGLGGQAAGSLLGRAITPVASRLSPEEQILAQAAKREGIPLSAGQATGSRPLQVVESVMENLPLTSGSQLAQREAQQRAFTAAVLRRGGMTGDSASAGPLLAQKQKLGGILGGIADNNSLDFNQGLLTKLANSVGDADAHLPQEMSKRVSGSVDQILNQVDQTGAMQGTNYQGWREPLRSLSTEPGTGRYFSDIRKSMDSAFRDQLPGAQGDLYRDTSRQYANTKTIIDAMGGAGNLPAKGQVAPAQLNAALSRSVGRENKALGVGDLNELVRVGQVFVRDQIPNSGTAQRQLAQSLLTTGGTSGLGAAGAAATGNDPMTGAAIGAGAMLSPKAIQTIMNSKAGQAWLKNALLQEYQREAMQKALTLGAAGSVPVLGAP